MLYSSLSRIQCAHHRRMMLELLESQTTNSPQIIAAAEKLKVHLMDEDVEFVKVLITSRVRKFLFKVVGERYIFSIVMVFNSGEVRVVERIPHLSTGRVRIKASNFEDLKPTMQTKYVAFLKTALGIKTKASYRGVRLTTIQGVPCQAEGYLGSVLFDNNQVLHFYKGENPNDYNAYHPLYPGTPLVKGIKLCKLSHSRIVAKQLDVISEASSEPPSKSSEASLTCSAL